MAKSSKELLAEAKKLMEQARRAEEGEALKIGKYVLSQGDKLSLPDLKKYIQDVTGGNGKE